MKKKKWILSLLLLLITFSAVSCGKAAEHLPVDVGEHNAAADIGTNTQDGQQDTGEGNTAEDNTVDTAENNTEDTAEDNTEDTAENNTVDTAEENAENNTENGSESGANAGEDGSLDNTGANDSGLSLEGKVLLLDPGHGGKYAGAVYDGRQEKDLVLQIAYGIKEYIEEQNTGLQIYMTREDDTVFSDDVAEDLLLRCQMAQEVGADIFVSLHLNATESHDNNGAMVLISKNEQVTDACSLLGTNILEELSLLGIRNRGTVLKDSNDTFDENGAAVDYYAINRHCAALGIPGIIVEHCFMDNESDIPFISSEEAVLALAQADAKGILDYFLEN